MHIFKLDRKFYYTLRNITIVKIFKLLHQNNDTLFKLIVQINTWV